MTGGELTPLLLKGCVSMLTLEYIKETFETADHERKLYPILELFDLKTEGVYQIAGLIWEDQTIHVIVLHKSTAKKDENLMIQKITEFFKQVGMSRFEVGTNFLNADEFTHRAVMPSREVLDLENWIAVDNDGFVQPKEGLSNTTTFKIYFEN